MRCYPGRRELLTFTLFSRQLARQIARLTSAQARLQTDREVERPSRDDNRCGSTRTEGVDKYADIFYDRSLRPFTLKFRHQHSGRDIATR